MNYEVVTTDAFIVDSNVSGEKDINVKIFGKNVGLINVVAKSAFKEESKLRSALQKYDYSKITLVLGNRTIVKDAKLLKGNEEILSNSEKLSSFQRVLETVAHFGGEEADVEVFETILEAIELLKSGANTKDVEYSAVIKIISLYGWSDENKELTKLIAEASVNRVKIIKKINKAFEEIPKI